MRCKACDYCDTTGESSAYHNGLKTSGYKNRWRSVGTDDYCGDCWIELIELYGYEIDNPKEIW